MRISDWSSDVCSSDLNATEGANRAAALTRRLLAFSRAEALLPEAIDAGALIAGMTELLDRTIGDAITVETRTGDTDWRIWADRHQLENAQIGRASCRERVCQDV